MKRSALLASPACLVGLAGCSGFGGGGGPGIGGVGSKNDGESGDPLVSVTPAPVPAAEGTERLAPGLTGASVENAGALAAAHNAVLRNQSFTIRTNRTTTYANGSFRGRTIGTVRVVPGRMEFETIDRTSGAPLASRATDYALVRSERWFGGERGLTAATFANGTTRYFGFTNGTGLSLFRIYTRRGNRFARLLSGAETRVTGRVERNGTMLYRIASSEPSSSGLARLPWFESVGNGTFEALVDPQGFVHRYRLTYTATTEGGSRLPIAQSVRYDDIRETAVSRPLWYDEALRSTRGRGDTGDASGTSGPNGSASDDSNATGGIEGTTGSEAPIANGGARSPT